MSVLPETWSKSGLRGGDRSGAWHAGASGKVQADKDDDPAGEKIEFKFMLPESGRFNLTFVLMPNCWVGCDVSADVNLNVLKQTAMEKQGKSRARGAKANPPDQDEDDDEVCSLLTSLAVI
jgi:hypothetical protein